MVLQNAGILPHHYMVSNPEDDLKVGVSQKNLNCPGMESG